MRSQQTLFVRASSNRPLVKVLFLMSVIIAVLWIASFFPDLILTLILSAFLAFILKPIVLFFEFRLSIRRTYSVLLVFHLLGGIFVTLGVIFVPMALERIKVIADGFKNFPFDEKLNEAAINLTSGVPFLNPETVTTKVHEYVQSGVQSLHDVISSAAEFLVNLVIIPFITFFILTEGDDAIKRSIERVPNKYFEMTLNVLNKIQLKLVGYLQGWFLDSVIVGGLNIISFYIIGVQYAILLGIVAGISNLIPYIGPFFGVIPALLVSLAQYGDFRQAYLILGITLVCVQLIDNVIIQPLCFSKTVDMHPVLVILVLIIGNSMMGIAGMLLAIPIATILMASAFETYWGLKNYQITA
jgi:putative permease